MALFYMNPSPTQHEFIQSQAFENCLVGPRGEGKTDAGQMAVHVHADRQAKCYRPMQWAIVRDTWKNLERTTLQSYLNPSPGSFAASIRSRIRSHDGGKILELPGWWKIYLFGVDTTSDLNAVLSLQLAGAWVEEAAPAAEMKETEMIGGGLAETTYKLLATSLRQHVSTNCRMQITMNYPDEEHWSWKLFYEHGDDERRLFRMPRGENKHVTDQYRKNMERALFGRDDLLSRLVYGKPARVQIGEKVTPEYDEDIHRSRVDLDPLPSLVGFRFWDGGRNPACLFHQITPMGQLICVDSRRGENVGLRQFIRDQVKPLIAARYPWEIVPSWRDLGDPSMLYPESLDTDLTAAKIIGEELFSTPNEPARFEGGVSDPFARRESLKQLLMNRLEDHLPMYRISKHEGILHRALAGGWHYHKDQAGRVLRDSPVKDIHSHPGDALAHSVAKLFPVYQNTGTYPEHYGTEHNMFA